MEHMDGDLAGMRLRCSEELCVSGESQETCPVPSPPASPMLERESKRMRPSSLPLCMSYLSEDEMSGVYNPSHYKPGTISKLKFPSPESMDMFSLWFRVFNRAFDDQTGVRFYPAHDRFHSESLHRDWLLKSLQFAIDLQNAQNGVQKMINVIEEEDDVAYDLHKCRSVLSQRMETTQFWMLVSLCSYACS
jgi:hypothetical protein